MIKKLEMPGWISFSSYDLPQIDVHAVLKPYVRHVVLDPRN